MNNPKLTQVIKVTYSILSIMLGIYFANLTLFLGSELLMHVFKGVVSWNLIPRLDPYEFASILTASNQTGKFYQHFSIMDRNLIEFTKVIGTTIIYLGIIFSIYWVRIILKNCISNNLFSEDNARQLKKVGATIILLSSMRIVIKSVWMLKLSYLPSWYAIFNFLGVFTTPFTVLGFVIYLLGLILYYGKNLKEENDLTV